MGVYIRSAHPAPYERIDREHESFNKDTAIQGDILEVNGPRIIVRSGLSGHGKA